MDVRIAPDGVEIKLLWLLSFVRCKNIIKILSLNLVGTIPLITRMHTRAAIVVKYYLEINHMNIIAYANRFKRFIIFINMRFE